MQIFVRNLRGATNVLNIEPHQSIEDVKHQIEVRLQNLRDYHPLKTTKVDHTSTFDNPYAAD